MFSLLPLPVTPIRPVSALLPPPPEPAPRSEPLPAPGPVTAAEQVDPARTISGTSAVVLTPALPLAPGASLSDLPGAGPEPSPLQAGTAQGAVASTDLKMRGNVARSLTQDPAAAGATPRLPQPEQETARPSDPAPRDGVDEVALARAMAVKTSATFRQTALVAEIAPATPDLAAPAQPQNQPLRETIFRDPAPEPRLILTR